MAEADCCPRCGDQMPANSPHGLCPACLLRQGLESEDPSPLHPGEPGETTQRHAKIPHGSMMEFLKSLLGEVPSILLRDSGTGPESPVVRPSSPEMPADQGRYQILGEIDHGGMGAVFKGRDPDLGRDLAIKVLLEKYHDDPEMTRRFVEEAQICGQLQHPGIVPVYELGSFDDGRPYFTMKLVKRPHLAALLKERSDPAHELPRFLGIFEQVCQTMAYAHARGVIHRDLKPSNVMVGAFGEVQVMDWGLAKVLPHGRNDRRVAASPRRGSRQRDSHGAHRLGRRHIPAGLSPGHAGLHGAGAGRRRRRVDRRTGRRLRAGFDLVRDPDGTASVHRTVVQCDSAQGDPRRDGGRAATA